MFRRILLHFLQKKEKALIQAAEEGRLEQVRTLLAAGVNPNAAGEGGFTALMWAAARGHIEVVQALLGSGAEVDAQSRKGRTARDIAIQEDRRDVVAVLGEAGERAPPGRVTPLSPRLR